jgi:sulfoxide reductase heme-binding subunit YedZ
MHLFWVTSRAAGTAAMALSSVSVAAGATIGGRLWRGRQSELRTVHEALSLAVLAAIVVHALALLGDSFFKASIADIAIPFASSYRSPWMAIGIVAGWSLIVLGLSYYVRDRIGVARWRALHRFTVLAWAAALAHSLGEGSDTGRAWFLALALIPFAAAAAVVAIRFIAAGEPAQAGASQPPLTQSLGRS